MDGDAGLDPTRPTGDLPHMPHRDDREAARHRIEALERELAEAKARSEREVAEAQARADRAERSAADARGRAQREPSRFRAEEEPRRERSSWPDGLQRRFRIAAAILVALVDLPLVVLLAGWRWDFDDGDASLLGWTFLPIAALVPIVYVLGRVCRAPFPSSAAMSSLLANGMGWFALHLAASDMIWGDVLAEPPWRWLVRGACGLAAAALHASVVAHWCAEAALSEVSSGD